MKKLRKALRHSKNSHTFTYPLHQKQSFSPVLLGIIVLLFVGGGYYILTSSHADAVCTQTISSGTNLSTTITGAAAGTVICLNNGSYGDVSLSGVSKSSEVTIQPVSGAAATLSSLTIASSSHLNFQSLTIGGVDLTGSSRNVTIAHSTFTSGSYINLTSAVNGSNPPDVVLDSDTFNGINQPADGYEGRVQFVGTGSDVQISNSYFGDGGCSDGIQTGANGGDIGPGNVFTDLTQVCSATIHHVDPFQIYGGNNLDIHGNYFADNGTGIMAPDGGTNQTITDNVFDSPNYPPLTLGSNNNDTITHNTTNGTFRIYEGNSGQNSTNNLVENNIIDGFSINANNSSPFSTEDYNIVSGGGGAHDIGGNPTYTGGSNPNTWAGWQLTAGSLGVGKASDGLNIGATSFGTTSSSPDTTPPSVSLSAPTNGATVSGTTTLTATASDNVAVSSVQFQLNGASLGSPDTTAPYTTSWNTTTSANGSYTLAAVATDSSGNTTTSAPVTVTVSNSTADTTPPTTTISSGPASSTTSTSASFAFTGQDNVTPAGSLSFQCQLDGGAYAACTSPKAYTGLAVGSHTFNVRATDAAGNTDPTPATQSWAITSTTAIAGDINGDGVVNVLDLSVLLSHYGTNYAPADLNHDNIVNIFDLSILLGNYGK